MAHSAEREASLAATMRPYAAGVGLVTDPDGRVLLVQGVKYDFWVAPGGVVDPGESPEQAAVRELFEETGLKLRAHRPLGVTWIGSGSGHIPGVIFHFDFGSVPGDVALTLQPAEVKQAAFVTPAMLGNHMGVLRADVTRSLLQARFTGQVVYHSYDRTDWDDSDRDYTAEKRRR